jgi:hypothetical protein
MKTPQVFRVTLIVSPLFLIASILIATPDDGMNLPADACISLADAVKAFNTQAAEDPIGKDQPVLTEDAVVAAVRWAIAQPKVSVPDETFHTLGEIIATRSLPKGFDLEKLTGYEPNDEVTFDVWSVRLRIPGGPHPGGTTCIMIQEKMIRSRVIGEEERKIIHIWEKKMQERGGIGSFERVERIKERATAAAIDSKNN